MSNVVEAPGRWLTVTGTLSDPPDRFSLTVRVYFVVACAFVPNAIFAESTSSSVIVTVAVAAPVEASLQPDTDVESFTLNVSSPSTRSSDLNGTVSILVLLPGATTILLNSEVPRSPRTALAAL